MTSNRVKQFFAILSILIYLLITYLVIHNLRELGEGASATSFAFLSLLLTAYILCIFMGWLGLGIVCGVIYAILAFLAAILSAIVGQSWVYFLFFFSFLASVHIVYALDKKTKSRIRDMEVEMEDNVSEKNVLELSLKEKDQIIKAYFEKHSNFYNLRTLTEELSKSLNINEISDLIVTRTAEYLPGGDSCLLYAVDYSDHSLSLLAAKAFQETKKFKAKRGDLFDQWVLKYRQNLIIGDIYNDFRFDIKKGEVTEGLKSLIIVPLMAEERVIGALRVNSSAKDTFSTDDLRLLEAIAGLASPALSNAMLYKKTEELAIKDSLTGLFVQRYFKERLQEEHRRSLFSKKPLSLLMCDLDRFKQCNDRYGHVAGDMVLARIGELIKKISGESAIVSRYGGEEFAVLLPDVQKERATEIAEAIRQATENESVDIRRQNIRITISIGVSSMPKDTAAPEELLRISDELLLKAKKIGRNKVCWEKE